MLINSHTIANTPHTPHENMNATMPVSVPIALVKNFPRSTSDLRFLHVMINLPLEVHTEIWILVIENFLDLGQVVELIDSNVSFNPIISKFFQTQSFFLDKKSCVMMLAVNLSDSFELSTQDHDYMSIPFNSETFTKLTEAVVDERIKIKNLIVTSEFPAGLLNKMPSLSDFFLACDPHILKLDLPKMEALLSQLDEKTTFYNMKSLNFVSGTEELNFGKMPGLEQISFSVDRPTSLDITSLEKTIIHLPKSLKSLTIILCANDLDHVKEFGRLFHIIQSQLPLAEVSLHIKIMEFYTGTFPELMERLSSFYNHISLIEVPNCSDLKLLEKMTNLQSLYFSRTINTQDSLLFNCKLEKLQKLFISIDPKLEVDFQQLPNLTELIIDCCYTLPNICRNLPNTLKRLTFGYGRLGEGQEFVIPKKLTHLTLMNVTQLPPTRHRRGQSSLKYVVLYSDENKKFFNFRRFVRGLPPLRSFTVHGPSNSLNLNYLKQLHTLDLSNPTNISILPSNAEVVKGHIELNNLSEINHCKFKQIELHITNEEKAGELINKAIAYFSNLIVLKIKLHWMATLDLGLITSKELRSLSLRFDIRVNYTEIAPVTLKLIDVPFTLNRFEVNFYDHYESLITEEEGKPMCLLQLNSLTENIKRCGILRFADELKYITL